MLDDEMLTLLTRLVAAVETQQAQIDALSATLTENTRLTADGIGAVHKRLVRGGL
jgi:hypothetical protein